MLLMLPKIDIICRWHCYELVVPLYPASSNRVEWLNKDDALNSEDADFAVGHKEEKRSELYTLSHWQVPCLLHLRLYGLQDRERTSVMSHRKAKPTLRLTKVA